MIKTNYILDEIKQFNSNLDEFNEEYLQKETKLNKKILALEIAKTENKSNSV